MHSDHGGSTVRHCRAKYSLVKAKYIAPMGPSRFEDCGEEPATRTDDPKDGFPQQTSVFGGEGKRLEAEQQRCGFRFAGDVAKENVSGRPRPMAAIRVPRELSATYFNR